MKSIHTLILLACVMCANVTAQHSKKTVAVLKFVSAGGVDNNEISIMTDRFNISLFNTNIYKVLEREKIDAILKAQDFNMSDNCNTTECAVQVGQLLGVDVMVAGKIGKFGQLYTIDLRMIDVSTGELLKTASENYEGKKEGLLGMIASMANTIANKADISAEALEQELAKLQKQNKDLEEQKNLIVQQENQKKQEELKVQLAAIEQGKKIERKQQAKTEAEKQKALEEQKRKQELFARIEEEKKKQAAVTSEDMTYLQAITRIDELQKSIESIEQEIDEQKQKAVSLAVDESPKGEFETQQEYNSRLYHNKQKSKQISDEYDVLKVQSKKSFFEELASVTSKKYNIGNETLLISLGPYNVDQQYFPIIVTVSLEIDPCDNNPIQSFVNSKLYVVRNEAKELRENESLLGIKATMLVSTDQKLTIDKITLVDVVHNRNYEFTITFTTSTGTIGIYSGDCNKMVFVKGGSFRMGDIRQEDTKPVHTVTVDDFYMSKYEVSQKEWRMIMGGIASNLSGCEDCPVEEVSWLEAKDFIKKLNEKTGKNYRLPYEAEWEFAAREGGERINSVDTVWGRLNSRYDLPERDEFYEKMKNPKNVETVRKIMDENYNLVDKITSLPFDSATFAEKMGLSENNQLGAKHPNRLGLYGLSGDVWEWCEDWYDEKYYSKSPQKNPHGTVSGQYRVCRGDRNLSTRSWYNPDTRSKGIGFRLVSE